MEAYQLSVVVLRSLQILFSLVCLACAGHIITTVNASFGVGGLPLWSDTGEVGLAVFAGLTGMLLSSLMLAATLVAALGRTLLGLVDLITSVIWSIFYLAVGAAMARGARFNSTWDAVVAMGFINFLLYAATAALAALDMKKGGRLLAGKVAGGQQKAYGLPVTAV